ncbi:hypothetical protein SASC598O11_000040, partial [Snodgrassella alvi SCGC AB-598-O11]
AVAQTQLGGFYDNGIYFKQDDMKAFEYYQLAADQGEVIAQYQLAYFYQIGKGVKQNDAKALEYYQLAAAQGNVDALLDLGKKYFSG